MAVPIWLLDVDGVINVTEPLWDAPVDFGVAHSQGQEWRMCWAPPLIDRIRGIATSRTAEIRWCSTWCDDAAQLEEMWRLPRLNRSFTSHDDIMATPHRKEAAAWRVLHEGRRLIWTDDMETPDDGPMYQDMMEAGSALLLRPDPQHGLNPADLDRIEDFLAD